MGNVHLQKVADPLRILLVVPTFPPDQCGVGDCTCQLALPLHAAGHRVGLRTTRCDAPAWPP